MHRLFILLSVFLGFNALFSQHTLTLNLDIGDFPDFDSNVHQIYVSGARYNAPGGIGNLPVWPIPGSNAGFLMSAQGNNIYSLTVNNVSPGIYAYKYFLVANNQNSWNLGEWSGDPNRLVAINDTNFETNDTWGSINNQSVQLVINEVMASNGTTLADEDGDFEDWIELYNSGNQPVNLNNFGLSDQVSNPMRWLFPNTYILPNQYLIVWASGKNRTALNQALHTNFSISSSGESILLSDQNGNLLDAIPAVNHQTDIAYGRFPNASSNLVYLSNPTPNQQNTGPAFDALSSPLTFSIPEGYYSENVSVSISSPDANTVIRYTLDGSEPTENSPIYNQPLEFGNLSDMPNVISNIPTNLLPVGPPYYEGWEAPVGNVYKINVLRAKPFSINTPPAESQNATYIIDPLVQQRFSLPVMSLTSDFSNLFDPQTGMYVFGNSGNYWQDWERAGNFTYFTKNGTLAFNEIAGFQLHGNTTRSRPRKSIRMVFQNQYGNSWLNYPVFENYPVEQYKRLILRNGGNDWGNSLMRDAMCQVLARDFHIETQNYQPTLLFINGEYWGIHNMRERLNHHYLEGKYGFAENEITILENNAEYKYGNPSGASHYQSLANLLQTGNLADDSNFQAVAAMMDVESFIDFQLANIFSKNTDWPGNNVLFWRYNRENFDPSAGLQDGRWRWMLYDMDFAFDLNFNYVPFLQEGAAHNTLSFAVESNGPAWPNPSWSTLTLRRLIENDNFKIQFANRYCDLLNTVYRPEFVAYTIDSISNLLLPEMQEHINRWRQPTSIESWLDEINALKSFGQNRAQSQRNHLKNELNLGNAYTLTVDVDDPNRGEVKLNTIVLNSQTNGIDNEVYPWQGIYFHNAPIQLKAMPKPGYVFSHWSGAISGTNPQVEINPNSATSIKAHFTAIAEIDYELLHFWFFGTALPNDTPITQIEPTFTTGHALLNYESCLAGYPFSPGEPNWRRASLERRNSPTPLNYVEEGNNDIPFVNSNIRGIQIKQPFRFEEDENSLILTCSTLGYEQILLQLAVIDEGAADKLLVEYRNPSLSDEFSSVGIDASTTLSNSYQVIQVPLNGVLAANNADTLELRIRFTGNNMTADQGNRVTMNNISISGRAIQDPIEEEEPPLVDADFFIFPNPASASVTVLSSDTLTHIEFIDMSGKVVMRFNTQGNENLDIHELAAGVYVVRAYTEQGEIRIGKLVKVQ